MHNRRFSYPFFFCYIARTVLLIDFARVRLCCPPFVARLVTDRVCRNLYLGQLLLKILSASETSVSVSVSRRVNSWARACP